MKLRNGVSGEQCDDNKIWFHGKIASVHLVDYNIIPFSSPHFDLKAGM